MEMYADNMKVEIGDPVEHIINVSIVLIYENEWWSAQCLEYDLASQGKNIKKAKESLEIIIMGTAILNLRDGKPPMADTELAPEEYWDMFNSAELLKQ